MIEWKLEEGELENENKRKGNERMKIRGREWEGMQLLRKVWIAAEQRPSTFQY